MHKRGGASIPSAGVRVLFELGRAVEAGFDLEALGDLDDDPRRSVPEHAGH
jgi:hypothetical protein